MAPSSSSKALDLPIVSYSILPREQQERQTLSHAPQYIQFGYNDNNKEWSGYPSTRYMRWIQPLEQELSKQVEYDMDEQDKTWLDLLNQERTRTTTNDPISYEVFEVIMDKLEKEWFDLTKSIPKKSNAVPTENEKCSICDDGECENSNAIVFCDGCNLAVHQDCYGVPYIPEGQWLCRKCTVSPDKPVVSSHFTHPTILPVDYLLTLYCRIAFFVLNLSELLNKLRRDTGDIYSVRFGSLKLEFQTRCTWNRSTD
jgi:hypothetical protein